MLNIGGWELLIILLVALVFLGPTRLPDVARQLGQTVSTLRGLASGFQAELEAASKPDATKTSDPSMTLPGPTEQDEAIASTQTDPFAGSRTDPFELREEVRSYNRDALAKANEARKSQGGPTDLTANGSTASPATNGESADSPHGDEIAPANEVAETAMVSDPDAVDGDADPGPEDDLSGPVSGP